MKQNASREKLLDAAYAEVYKHGYHGAATADILKNSQVPKGSMYHHFDSKQALVLGVIEERIFPKMDRFFTLQAEEGESVVQALQKLFEQMSGFDDLIRYGCPLHRLMVEMASLDPAFDKVLVGRFEIFVSSFKTLLDKGVTQGEFDPFDTRAFSEFLIASTWGRLSLSPTLSSKEAFLIHTNLILDTLKLHLKK